MKTLGISKVGLNNQYFYDYLLNDVVKLNDKVLVENVDFNKNYDFILFDGGSDVSPILYGEEKQIHTFNDSYRDVYEGMIFDQYINYPTKFIGICRGSQFLNVMFGGTLYQDLPSINKGHSPFHKTVLNDSITDKFSMKHFLPNTFVTNSTHHQAVKKLGKNLIVNSFESLTYIVESYTELHDKVRATQYHPEFINDFPYTHEIIKWLFREL